MNRIFKIKLRSIFFILIYVLFVIAVWYYVSSFLVDKESVRSIVSGYGIFAPLIFILIQIFQNVIAPVAHYPILLAGGFIFGPALGFFYNWIGTTIGTFLIILLTKKFGRPLVEKMVKKDFIDKYDRIIKKLSPFGLFVIYFLPGFPDDEITYLVGLSSMPIKSIFFAILFGKTGGATLSFLGNDLVDGSMPTLIVNVAVFLIAIIFYFGKDILRKLKTKKHDNADPYIV